MNQYNCINCKYYVKHYIKLGKKYQETPLGHCIYPRIKTKKSDSKICEHFIFNND